MCLECSYKLPAMLLRKQAERVVVISAKLNEELLDERDIGQRTEQLLRYVIEPSLRQYNSDYQRDDYAPVEIMLSELWAECNKLSLCGLDVYERELEKISYYLLNRYEQLMNEFYSFCSTNSLV